MTSMGPAVAVLVLLAAARAGAECPGPGWAAWARALEAHTAPVSGPSGVGVDYEGLREDPSWERVVASLEACRPETLATRAERLAFWINAYNILAIDMVVAHGPVESIRDIGSFFRPVWKREAGRIGGEGVTLDAIEHEILRPLGEPRIHGAIVCASRSCPPLRREPYRADRLDAQLDEGMRRWLADPRTGARLEGDTLQLSAIFDWFAEDFGGSDAAVVEFVRPYLPQEVRARLPAAPRLRTLDYDWRLNALDPGERARPD